MPNAMMSKTAIATPMSPAQASLTADPICWRSYFAVTPSAAKPRRYTSDVTASASYGWKDAPVGMPRRPPVAGSGTISGSEP